MTKENAIHTVSVMRDEIAQASDTLAMFHIQADPFDRLWGYVLEGINDTLASAGLPSIEFPAETPPLGVDYFADARTTPYDEWEVEAVAEHRRYIRAMVKLIDDHLEEVR